MIVLGTKTEGDTFDGVDRKARGRKRDGFTLQRAGRATKVHRVAERQY